MNMMPLIMMVLILTVFFYYQKHNLKSPCSKIIIKRQSLTIKRMAKNFKDWCTGINIKQEMKVQLRQMNIYIFRNPTL